MNNRQKMRIATTGAKRWLEKNNYKDIHLFPHTRWSLDVHFQGLEFDGCASLGKQFVLFQVKTNCKPTKQIQEQMKKVEKESYVKMLWFNKVKGSSVMEVYP